MEITLQLRKLTAKVEYILHLHPSTRNCDKLLYITLIREFFYNKIKKSKSGKEYISLESLLELPSAGDVRRHRAHIQNKLGNYLPTDINIRVNRLRNMPEEHLRALDYDV